MLWTKKYDFLGISNGAVNLQEEEHEKEQHLISPIIGKDFRKNILYLPSRRDLEGQGLPEASSSFPRELGPCGPNAVRSLNYAACNATSLLATAFVYAGRHDPPTSTIPHKRTWKSQSIIPLHSSSFPTIIFHRPHSRPHQQALLPYLQLYA
jgi:hypothetical protein